MTCARLVELVTDYLEGTLVDTERARFEEHLAECAMCRVHLDRMRRIIRELGELPSEAGNFRMPARGPGATRR